MRTSGGKGLRGESVGSSALLLSKPCSLKPQSGLSLEGPLVVLSDLWRREFVCMCVGLGGQRQGNLGRSHSMMARWISEETI